jgi:hypothetical protein
MVRSITRLIGTFIEVGAVSGWGLGRLGLSSQCVLSHHGS